MNGVMGTNLVTLGLKQVTQLLLSLNAQQRAVLLIATLLHSQARMLSPYS